MKQRNLEQELWESQQLFSNAFENAPIGMSLVTLEGKWVRANRALCEMVGYSEQELLTKTFQEITHPDDLQADLEFVRQMTTGEIATYHMEKRYFHKSGNVVWVELSVSMMRDTRGAPRYFIAQIQDITERKRAEETLRASEARYRSLFDEMLDGFALHEIICDDAGKPIDYRFLEVNPAFTKMTGLTADMVLGKTVREVLPQLEASWIETYGRVALTGEPTDFVQYAAPLNRYYHVRAFSPRAGQFATVFEDVTANIRAQNAEREQRALAEALLDTSAALNSTWNLDAVLDCILDNVGRVLAHDAANIMLRAGKRLRVVRDRGYAERDPRSSLVGMTFSVDALHGIRQALATGEPFVVHDTQADPDWTIVPESRWVRSFLGVPIRVRGQVIGVLNLDSDTPNFYRDKSLAGIEGFANQAGVAIHNAQLLQETQRRLQHIQALHVIDRAINASLELKMTLDMLLGETLRVLEVDAADVLLLNRHAPLLEFAAGRGFSTGTLRNLRVRVGEGYAGAAAMEQRSVYVADLSGALEGLNYAPQLRQENFVSYAAAPLIAKGRVVGVLELYRRTRLDAPDDWRALLEALAQQAALAIENAHLFEEVNRANAELRLAYDATIEGWARALDLHDKEFDGHTERVTVMTLRLARTLGVAEEELVHWRRGALLHDIGKLGIPDTILRKPGRLDEHEQEIMRRHPQLAYELLAPIQYLRPALEIPYCHHEKWDGSGYPRGLKGNAIPLAARVFAVAHVWDALLSERPYRDAWSKERAFKYLRKEAGAHFDPEIVRVFFALLDER